MASARVSAWANPAAPASAAVQAAPSHSRRALSIIRSPPRKPRFNAAIRPFRRNRLRPLARGRVRRVSAADTYGAARCGARSEGEAALGLEALHHRRRGVERLAAGQDAVLAAQVDPRL